MASTAYRLFCLRARERRVTLLGDRARDTEGQFAPQSEGGGIDPHAIEAAYGPAPGAPMEEPNARPGKPGSRAILARLKATRRPAIQAP